MIHPTLSLLLIMGLAGGEGVGVGSYDAEARSDPRLRLMVLGSWEEERLRLRQLTGRGNSTGLLLRSPSTLGLVEGPGARELEWVQLGPELHSVWNSDLPFSMNQGALWAGRGLSARMTFGARIRWGAITVVLAPHLLYEENREFQTVSNPQLAGRVRDPLASPFHFPPGSMDLAQRPGREHRSFLDPGQSSVTVHTGPVAWGAATENLWWGPGIRNGIVMSAQAPGVPHLFLRTARPLTTRIGTFDARWIVGRLDESAVFDFDPTNDHRSLSALALAYTPAFAPSLSVGLARSVYAPADRSLIPVGAAFDVLRSVGRPNHAPGDTLLAPGPDQLFSLFGRWVFPEAGFEAYGEWGRYEQPKNLRDFLELPQHSRGYTVGLQFARPAPAGTTFRLQAELTNVEPSTSFRVRPFGEWYASRAVPQGYTHRGQVIGAAIGPSGSGQWLAGDLFGERWSFGTFGGRIRWENQAQFTFPPEFRRADVSLFAGVRAAVEAGPLTISAEYTGGVRLNYLFQAEFVTPVEDRGVDIRNHTLQLTVASGSPLS